jgi:hypothetical protein
MNVFINNGNIVAINIRPSQKLFREMWAYTDMHIGDKLWAISGKYLDMLSSLVIFLSEI